MSNRNYFINGITDMLILSILSKHDSYVYEITKMISNGSGGALSISQNTIYTAAYKLENDNKISERSVLVGKKRTRIYYHIEPAGVEYLKELTKSYDTTTLGVKNILNLLSTEKEEVNTDGQDL